MGSLHQDTAWDCYPGVCDQGQGHCFCSITSLLWPIDTKLAVWVAYIKTQPGIATHMSVMKVKVSVTKKEIQFPLNNFSLLWPIDTKLAVWVAYIKTQLGIAAQVSLIKVKVSVTKNRNSVSAL